MTQREIHTSILFRLVPAWFVLSVIIGTAVYSVELAKIDDHVVTLAAEQSMAVLEMYRKHLHDPQNVDLGLYVKKNRDASERGSFIIAELYNGRKELIAEEVSSGSESVEAAMDTYKHEFMMTAAAQYKKLLLGPQLYVMVMEPLKMEDGSIGGYFEGVYEVGQRALQVMRQRINWSVMQVIMIISVTTLILYPLILSLNGQLIGKSVALFHANLGMVEILGNAIAKKDCGTSIHNYRVTIYAIRLAETIGLGREEMKGLIKGAFLHDVGKIAISDAILLKPDGLTPDETAVMNTHVQHGIDIIRDYQWLSDAQDVVSCHHEKFDGNGFLKGLKGAGIPLTARVFAVCDVFDALTSRRPYKEPLSFDQSMQMIRQLRGTHFDPMIVDAFDRIAEKLYDDTSNADEAFLKQELKQLMDKYFDVQSSETGGAKA